MKSIVKTLANNLGYEIKKITLLNSSEKRMQKALLSHNIDIVLDVGANIGQYAKSLRKLNYAGKIISFEPLNQPYEQLVRNSQNDPLWEIAPRMAIGDKDAEIEINVSANSYSSSIRKILEAHINNAPASKYVGKESVAMAKLDSIGDTFVSGYESVFLKIDTQGYESNVIEGAMNFLKKVKGMQIELSLVPLYEEQALFVDLLDKIYSLGYELYDITPIFLDQASGRMLQVDGVFFKSGS